MLISDDSTQSLDQDKYVGLLTTYLMLTFFIGMTTLLTSKIFLLMNVQHICAMFQITSYRIERIVNKSQVKSLVFPEKFNNYKNIIEAVDLHRNALKLVLQFIKYEMP
ncbi:uncharacterized protein LOC113003321 isoform X2 [Solenopsis invicta]|uniref:uncharacterized protein LOC113003321 isoform X2 n=1 Tax=Solenopsis invicta TaxID=13686 RepID=UPI00193E9C54|nr:uncharacterized protein LOC113003321 isoform X2 [Solenopsis invicta]XP_039311591.1 uncharacterized protein LOC113003321 isoform X2 [Solenopsis invicta]